jgi:BAI1-associated protein 3
VGPYRQGGARCSLTPQLGPHRHWQVSSRHHQTRTLDYGYLLGLLEDMQAHWEEAALLPQEQVGTGHRSVCCW